MARLKEHDDQCKAIVTEIENYASGIYFKYHGDIYPLYEYEPDFWDDEETENAYIDIYDDEDASGDEYENYYIIDGVNVPESDIKVVSLYDYFDDVLDVDYIVDMNLYLNGVRIMIACGGPDIFINTMKHKVELYWANESGEAWLPSEYCNEILDIYEEEWRNILAYR